MSQFPTPFVGGADDPNADHSASKEWAPPFSTDMENPAPAAPAAPAVPGGAPEPAAPPENAAEPSEETPIVEPAAATATEPTAETDEAGGAEDSGDLMPDFLMGSEEPSPSSTVPPEHDAEILELSDLAEMETPEAARPVSKDALSEKAVELLAGTEGGWIRTLVSDLEGGSAEHMVTRAYAAGYLARVREES